MKHLFNTASAIFLLLTTHLSLAESRGKFFPFENERPPQIQKLIHETFFKKAPTIASASSSLMGFDYGSLIDGAIRDSGEKTDLYFIELGVPSHDTMWITNAYEYLKSHHANSTKTFHLIGVTSEAEQLQSLPDSLWFLKPFERVLHANDFLYNTKFFRPKIIHKIFQDGNIVVRNISGFDIENMDRIFFRLGLHLENSVELIVSSMTFRHLTDPYGTLVRAYSLLVPGKGKLLSDDFFVPFIRSHNPRNARKNLITLLSASPAKWLLRTYGLSNYFHFILLRTDYRSFNSNKRISYTGKIFESPGGMFHEPSFGRYFSHGNAELEVKRSPKEKNYFAPICSLTDQNNMDYYGTSEMLDIYGISENCLSNQF